MDFLTTVLYILLGYYALKLLFRYLAPFILKRAVNRFQKKMGVDPNTFNTHPNDKKQPETNSTPKSKKTVGEYIDYEEIE
jgi:hypothetical protein